MAGADIADLVAPRLTDAELDALLATISRGGYVSLGTRRAVLRLATEVRDLRKVARAIAKEPDELVSGAILEIARRYEEGSR